MRSELRVLAVLAALSTPVAAQRLEPQEAMQLCCPDSTVVEKVVTLTQDQLESIAQRSGESVPSSTVRCFEARHEDQVVAVGYLDVHRVRSKKQALLVVVACTGKLAGTVQRIEVLAFAEPRRYLPSDRFYEQFHGRTLGPDLREGRDIRRVGGATMTTRVTVAAVRRVLATHGELTQARR